MASINCEAYGIGFLLQSSDAQLFLGFLSAILFLTVLLVLVALFFSPTIIALKYCSPERICIVALLNLFFGWSGLGWCLAFWLALDAAAGKAEW